MTSQKEQLSYLLKSDKDLEELISSIPKIVPFKREKGFEGLVRLICEQQLSVACLLYTSPSPRDNKASRMPSSA